MIRIGRCCLLLSLLTCTPAKSEDGPEAGSADPAAQFSRKVLLRQFDRNRDGRLNDKETSVLRDAFGGIDVPMLPDESYDYTHVDRPGSITPEQLRNADNTPEGNPLTNPGATLGRVLLYDRQLSENGAVSCASCHDQKAAFADPRRFSIGFNGERTRRNSMGLTNIRYTHLKGRRPGFFWDERAPTLEAQALMPIQDEIEMGMKLKDLNKKLGKLPYYPPLFAAAFGSTEITSERIARALAQFMRSMVSLRSKFDRAAAAAAEKDDNSTDFDLFTAQENLGKSLFMEGIGGIAEFGCAVCHPPPTFNMDKAQNVGLDLKYRDKGLGALGRQSNEPFTPSNDGKFKASSLRNIALTAPYMHDGRFKTLDQVVKHYSSGVQPHPNLGLAPREEEFGAPGTGFHLSKDEQAALVAFLRTLTDDQFVSDPRFSDPFVRAPH
ncbi:MAG TPA: cytochrome c peroxidase [Roseibacillus sp.]|jgi:cytochrome c peroxidase|nr:cytochrome c peroxidase [Roseibacillus sp.]|tara:strand:+ start:3200 stop:4513 length:1314 start_codon:yes stop_codon:yes gene_type:complete